MSGIVYVLVILFKFIVACLHEKVTAYLAIIIPCVTVAVIAMIIMIVMWIRGKHISSKGTVVYYSGSSGFLMWLSSTVCMFTVGHRTFPINLST